MNNLREDYTKRWDRWIEYAKFSGIHLDRLLVHPDDVTTHRALTYRGLPVVAMGESVRRKAA